MLYWAIEEAPNNVHFLLGNHEDMAYRSLLRIQDDLSINSCIYDNPWSYNGGYQTLDQCRELYGSHWCHKAAAWISHLPLYYIVDDKLLIHAGLCENGIRLYDDYNIDGRQEYVDIPNIETSQWAQHLLWIRNRWFYNQTDYPYDIIFGHSPTSFNWMKEIKENSNNNIDFEGEPGKIIKISGFNSGHVRYCIDTGRQCIGLLRLNDYKEFYSELKEEK